jgi:hypothetical protein
LENTDFSFSILPIRLSEFFHNFILFYLVVLGFVLRALCSPSRVTPPALFALGVLHLFPSEPELQSPGWDDKHEP